MGMNFYTQLCGVEDCPGRASCILPVCPGETNKLDGDNIIISAGPIQVIGPGGIPTPIDCSIDLISFKPINVPYSLQFSDRITSAEAIQFATKEEQIQFGLVGYGYADQQITEDSLYSVIEGNKITYHLSWGRIQYEVMPGGVKETIFIDNKNLPDPSSVGVPLSDLTVDINFGLPPSSLESELWAITGSGHSIPVSRTQTGISLSYSDYDRAVLPITIDPTLTSTGSNSGYQYVDSYKNLISYLSQGVNKIGGQDWFDKDTYSYSLYYRAFDLFNLSAYAGYTLKDGYWSGNVFTAPEGYTIGYKRLGYAGSSAFDELTNNWVGSITPTTLGYTSGPSLKKQLLGFKGLAGQFEVIIKGDESAYSGTARMPSEIYGGSGNYPPRLVLDSYSNFVQNLPTQSKTDAIISWVNGGGLVTGDYHRIYYASGTGLTVAQIKAAGIYVQSPGYDATSVNIPGLVPGNWSFVVVDVQVADGVAYEGATSNVQTLNVTPAVTITVVTGAAKASISINSRAQGTKVQQARGYADVASYAEASGIRVQRPHAYVSVRNYAAASGQRIALGNGLSIIKFSLTGIGRIVGLKSRHIDCMWVELPERFGFVELPERFSWKGDEIVYIFTLGEKKEVAGTIMPMVQDGIFKYSAEYHYMDKTGALLGDGTANVVGNKIFTRLEPTVLGSSQKLVYTVTCTPVDANGDLDPTRNVEIKKCAVAIHVNKE